MHPLTGNQIGIVGNTMHQSGLPTTFADSADIPIDSKQIALSSASMLGQMNKDNLTMEQAADLQMQQ